MARDLRLVILIIASAGRGLHLHDVSMLSVVSSPLHRNTVCSDVRYYALHQLQLGDVPVLNGPTLSSPSSEIDNYIFILVEQFE